MPLLPAATFEGAHEGAQGAHGDHDERHEATPKDELAEGRILVVCRDRRRLLVDVSEAISDAGDLSILGVRTQSHRNGLATMEFHLGGPTRECIALSVEAVKKVDGVQQAFMFAGTEMQFN
jgi:(p)ppGpp synthase/HD superfamily hydrolase